MKACNAELSRREMRQLSFQKYQAKLNLPKLTKKEQKKREKVDTIPASIKSFFFAGKDPPKLLSDYDVVGFDADSSLVKYDMNELVRLVTIGHMK
jgi:hypothetical protein